MYKFLLVCFCTLFSICCLEADNVPTIKAVAFDFGGVVATVDKSELENFLVKSFHVSKQELEPIFEKWKECLVQGEKEKQFWQDFAASKNVTLPVGWFLRFEDLKTFTFAEIPETVAIVKELKRQGFQTPMLTNVTQCHADIIRKLGYYDLFSPLLLSYEINVVKPNPRAYEILLESLNLPSKNVVFVDDRIENVEAANKLGIHGIHFKDGLSLINELSKLGIVVDIK